MTDDYKIYMWFFVSHNRLTLNPAFKRFLLLKNRLASLCYSAAITCCSSDRLFSIKEAAINLADIIVSYSCILVCNKSVKFVTISLLYSIKSAKLIAASFMEKSL